MNLNDFTSGITTIDVGGYSDYLIGFETSLPWDREESTWTVSTTATKMWGNHTMKVGGDLRSNRHLLDQVNHPRGPSSTAATRRRSTPTQPHRTATRIRSPHSCWTCRTALNEDCSPHRHHQIHRGGTHKAVYTYVHDKWQMRPDITLDLGLRHELYMPLVGYTPVGGQATYDPTPTPFAWRDTAIFPRTLA